jgi:alpha-1,6-mannosyltransferase
MLAYGFWFQKLWKGVVICFAATIIIWRSEVVLLAGPLALQALITRELSFKEGFIYGLISLIIFLPLTILVDSVFWKRWLWPEGEVFWYNTYHNKSSNWGVWNIGFLEI